MASLDRLTLRQRRKLIALENAAVDAAVEIFDRKAGAILQRLRKMEDQLSRGELLTDRQITQARRDRARLLRLMREVRDDVRDSLQQSLQAAAEEEVGATVQTLSAGLPEGVTGRAPAVDLQELILNPTAGRGWAARLDASLTRTVSQIDSALAVAINRGASMPNATRAVRDALTASERQSFNLKRLVRTEIQRVSNEAAQTTYRQNRDVIQAVRYLATLDSRVCEICRPYHRRVFPLDAAGDHAGPTIPQHPNCRCFYAPVTRSLSEILEARG